MDSAVIRNETLKKLKCAECSNYLSYLPITYKEDVGFICGRCYNKYKDSKLIRNEIYEHLMLTLKFPCRYKNCLEILTPTLIPQHEKICSFKIIDCPSSGDTCLWKGSTIDLFCHFEEKHPSFILTNFEFEVDIVNSYEDNLLLPYINDLFLVKNVYDSTKKTYSSSVQYLGYTTNSEYYVYELTIQNSLKTHIINFEKRTTNGDDKNCITEFNIEKIKTELSDPIAIIATIKISESSPPTKNLKDNPKINFDLLSLLECPFCFEFMLAPIFQCLSGHTICNSCKITYKVCPTCNDSIQDTRNYHLEKISELLNYPCRYHENGCDFIEISTKLKEHENYCKFGIHKCPVKDYVHCTAKLSMDNIMNHITNHHDDHLLDTETISETFINNVYEDNDFCYVLKYSSKIFVLYYCYCNSTFYWSMQIIGTKDEAEKFSFEIDFINKKSRVYIKAPVIALTSREEFLNNLKKCVSVTLIQIEDFIQNDILSYGVRIVE